MPYYVHDKIISPNIWDEQWEVGQLNSLTGGNEFSSTRIRSKNYIQVIPNMNIYCYNGKGAGLFQLYYYDANKNYLFHQDGKSGFQTVPSNAVYLRFFMDNNYGNTYDNDICINESNPAINGHYYPYNMGAKKYVIKDNNKSMNIGG